MNAPILDPHISKELKAALDRGLATGDLMTPEQVAEQTGRFRDRFGPDALRGLDDEPLLRLMHGRQDSASRCLAYWLEYKNDDEFAGNRFGGIGGGSALKFGIFQRQSREFAAAVKVAGKPVQLIEAPNYAHLEMCESLGNPYGANGLAALAMMKLK